MPRPTLRFTLPGPGQSKGRHRSGIRRKKTGELYIQNWTPQKTESYEKLVQLYAKHAIQRAGGWEPRGQFGLTIRTYKAQPESRPKAWKALAEEDRIWDGATPDWDNTGKIISDAMNKLAYIDDARIVWALTEKHYAKAGEAERVEVTLEDRTDPEDRWSRR